MNHRILCFHQALRDLFRRALGNTALLCLMAFFIGSLPEFLIHFPGEHVHRNVNQHRAGSAGLRQPKCPVHDHRKGFHIIDSPGTLHHRTEQFILVAVLMELQFLMGVTAEIEAGDIASDENHGDGVQLGVRHAGDDIRNAGAQMAHHHRGLIGDTGIAVSRSGCDRLVTGSDILDFFAAGQSVQHADDGMAAETEELRDTPALKIVDNQIRYKFFCHDFSPLSSLSRGGYCAAISFSLSAIAWYPL